uniref:Uncharacterized protein n=1 Tax=Candidatus Kentrum eta TaxID=2126337 RepID=A0A450US09_9GAMM|nr:MAG: hypothetical protein BECKH772A_GA0070896_100718 [Candidatus Kentron sp. H]VFJ95256.1 MAG: hypothetical protein BECKH772B_GA0070898_100748 [Candidatus Kentron sp. H]VFK01650.1 MAG: hypothetical protein BECKH772C_GA0070978_100708 [Candidatus Kentron sp. H]
MKVGNSNDNNPQFPRLGQRFIDDAIREPTHLSPTNVPSKRLPRQGKMLDALDSRPCLIPEFVAKPGSLRIISSGQLLQVRATQAKEIEPSSVASKFSEYLIRVNGRKLSGAIGIHAILCLLQP